MASVDRPGEIPIPSPARQCTATAPSALLQASRNASTTSPLGTEPSSKQQSCKMSPCAVKSWGAYDACNGRDQALRHRLPGMAVAQRCSPHT
jgi:hypothetical protein